MYSISKITNDDVAICVNYVTDEYTKLVSDVDTTKLAIRMEYAIEDKLGWKVEKDGVIIGFAVVEPMGGSLLITSLVVNDLYRTGKTTWMLFDKILEEAGERRLLYIPMHKDMWASNLCKDGLVDKNRAKEWVAKLANKWRE